MKKKKKYKYLMTQKDKDIVNKEDMKELISMVNNLFSKCPDVNWFENKNK